MTTFSDNFNRADGALGSPWTLVFGDCVVDNNQAVSANGAWERYSTSIGAGRHRVSLTVIDGGSGHRQIGPVVKWVAGAYSFYYAYVDAPGGTWTAYIRKSLLDSHSTLQSAALGGSPGSSWVIELEYDSGTLTMRVGGAVVCTAEDNAFDTAETGGMLYFNQGGTVDDWSATSDPAVSLDVSPDPMYVGAGPVSVTALLTGQAWTPGTPGSSTMSVDHGTISDQITTDATHMTFTLTPAEYVGALVFTESEFGASDTVTSTLTPPGGGGEGECPFDEHFIGMANQTGDNYTPGSLLTDSHVVHLSPVMNIPRALDYVILLLRNLYPGGAPFPPDTITPDPRLDLIWNAVNGGVEQPQGLYSPTTDQPVKLDTEQSLAILTALTSTYTNLNELVALLGGSPTVYSHADLKTQIDLLDTASLDAKLDAIWGSSRPTLTDLAEILDGIRTIAGYDLGTVLDAVRGLNGMSAGELRAWILEVNGVLGGLGLAIAGVAAAETADAASSAAAAAEGLSALAALAEQAVQLLEILNQLKELQSAQPTGWYHPPVWPGLAHVQMGTPQDLESSLVVPGPMHGVCVNITSTDPGTGHYDYDVDRCWRNIGAVSFVTDRGDHEHWQPLGFSSGMFVPKTMHEAASCKLHLGRGPKGTITPWSIVNP